MTCRPPWRLLLLAVLGVWMSAARAADAPKVPEGWSFRIPVGDSEAGRTLFFERLVCSSCHDLTLPGVTAKPGYSQRRPGHGEIGPALDRYVGLPREYLADAIIRAHTVVAAPGYEVRPDGPRMGNYNHLLLVQELIDLVAFLHGPR